jgi:hypothetical protein
VTRTPEPKRPGSDHLTGSVGPATSPPPSAAWLLALVGGAGAVVAAAADPTNAAGAAGQDWPPFVLVAGLLLIGLVADKTGCSRPLGSA